VPDIFPAINVPTIDSQATVSYGKELAFDFGSGEFSLDDGKPRVVEGLEALEVWIEKAIRTARYRFPIYSFEYGCELEDIIGKDIPRAIFESEIKRVITEALIYDDRISDVKDFKFTRGGDWLRVEFTVVTVRGDSLGVVHRV
jgi:hypothetical protein